MAQFVVDASTALAWCFEDETTPWTEGLLDLVRRGQGIVVPAHWPTEILNGLLVAARRNRIKPEQPGLLWEELSRFPIEAEPPLTSSQAKSVLRFSERHNLTVYDAAYLELADRRRLPFATLDVALREAAQADALTLL